MTDFDAGQTLADRFRAHARDHTHLYGHAMRGMADDWEAGGAVRDVCAGYEEAPPGSVIQLRLLAGVFRLVLQGRADELRGFYPCLGGDRPADQAWPVMLTTIAAHRHELAQALAVAPQTNEVGRAAALLVGLFDLVQASGRNRIRLLEVGASAGLNLLVDRMCLRGTGWQYGPAGSPVQLDGAVEGELSVVPFTVVEARGCDLSPVDATTEQGRQLLTSFVWPFDLHRHARLRAALEIAGEHPPVVDRAGASDWLGHQLPADESDDALTVVWHSISQLYWPPAETRAVDAVLARAGAAAPLARVSMEYSAGLADKAQLRTTLWSPGETTPRTRRLGTVHDHGLPVRLAPTS